MEKNKKNVTNYKNLYFELKKKYDNIRKEFDELKNELKIKEEEINQLKLKLNNILKDDLSNFVNDNISIYKHNAKKFDTYSIDSFRLDQEQGNDLLQGLMLNDLDENKNKKKKYELVGLLKVSRKGDNILYYSFSKFNNVWFLSQRYKGIEQIEMNESHRRSKNVRMIFYQASNKIKNN